MIPPFLGYFERSEEIWAFSIGSAKEKSKAKLPFPKKAKEVKDDLEGK